MTNETRRWRYVIKDANGNHWDFEPRERNIRTFRECLEHAESRLCGSFSGGEVVSIRRVFKNGDKFKPIPQDHRPREIGA